jgi:hypothetical protein
MAAPHAAGVAALWAQTQVSPGQHFKPGALLRQMEDAAEALSGLTTEEAGAGLLMAPP